MTPPDVEKALREPARPEVALRAAQSMAQRRERASGRLIPKYHALNAEMPWLTACGYPIDWDSARPLGVGDLECLTPACQRVLRRAHRRLPDDGKD